MSGNAGYQFYKGVFTEVIRDDDWSRYGEADAKSWNCTFVEHDFSPSDLTTCLEKVSTIQLKTTYPGLVIGAGYEHEARIKGEFKLGFHFDHTTGLPMIPGSSIKGVLRSAFPQYAGNPVPQNTYLTDDFEFRTWAGSEVKRRRTEESAIEQERLLRVQIAEAKCAYLWGKLFPDDTQIEIDDAKKKQIHSLEMVVFEGIDWENSIQDNIVYLPVSQRVIFHDAFPLLEKTTKILAEDVLTPHRSDPFKDPLPLPFLIVRPNIIFNFPIAIPNGILGIKMGSSSTNILNTFKHILENLGVGAKTNVGYGRLEQTANTNSGGQNKKKVHADDLLPQQPEIKKGVIFIGKITGEDGNYWKIVFEHPFKDQKKRPQVVKNTIYRAKDKIKDKIDDSAKVGSQVQITVNEVWTYGKEKLNCKLSLIS